MSAILTAPYSKPLLLWKIKYDSDDNGDHEGGGDGDEGWW